MTSNIEIVGVGMVCLGGRGFTDFKIREDDRAPPYPKIQDFLLFLSFFGALDPPNPSKLPGHVFSIQAKPGNSDVHGFRSDFDQSREFGIPDFCVQGFWPLDSWVFGVRILDLTAITSKTSPPGAQHFQKRRPPGFQEQGGSGFPKNFANHLLPFLKSAPYRQTSR